MAALFPPAEHIKKVKKRLKTCNPKLLLDDKKPWIATSKSSKQFGFTFVDHFIKN
ncbi:MAG TPA: hypothetical protein VLE95_00770 [Chlamydiales bacterium]|nr:hypothetical protein [Chlamydiales bacterium]